MGIGFMARTRAGFELMKWPEISRDLEKNNTLEENENYEV